ncbi:MAG: DUF4157 domain-containing protein [Pseudomonadota bacterium]
MAGFHRSPEIRSILGRPRLQPKLTIGAVDDPAEREADRMADKVMGMPEPGVTGSAVSALVPEGTISRKCADCEENTLRRKPADDAENLATPDVHKAVTSLGSGLPLPSSERNFFEPRFGRDFSNVRLHTDQRAGTAADAINARAFTHGSDVAFGAGEYRPGTTAGRRLMAHELAHVGQQAPRSQDRGTLRRSNGASAALPSVISHRFVNTGNTAADNCCRLCPVALGVRAGGLTVNGMELQFTLDGHRAGLWYDILRTRRAAIWELTPAGNWNRYYSDPSGTWDDSHNRDECLTPRNRKIFVIDRPGWRNSDNTSWTPARSNPGSTEVVQIVNFAEWVNVKDPGAGGSWTRISRLVFWHTRLWLKKNAAGNWVVDVANSEIATGSLPGSSFTAAPR